MFARMMASWAEAPNKEGDIPISMVLLLREPRFSTLDQLRSAARRAFGTSFTGDKESQHYVIQVDLFTIMKAGPNSLSFLNHRKPYGDESHSFERSLPKARQCQAWAEHTAWTTLGYVKGSTDPKLEYVLLAKLCAEMLDANCVGLYVPGTQTYIPNDVSLQGELQSLGCHVASLHRFERDSNSPVVIADCQNRPAVYSSYR
jgi:hypothetical protein